MLTKLLKYEIRTTARMLLPIYAGLLLAWGVERGYTLLRSGLHLNSMIPSIVEVLLLLLYGLTLLAAGLMTVYVNVRQFYRLLGEDGYFLFPLPASAAQHMAAKLLCGVGWMVAYFLLGALLNGPGAAASTADGAIVGVGDTQAYYYFAGRPLAPGTERILTAGLVGLGVLAFVCEYLFIYLCIIIGGHWPQRRALVSVLAYFGLNFAWQVVFIGAVVGAANFLMSNEGAAKAFVDWLTQFVDNAQRVDAIAPMVWALLGIGAAVLAAAGIVLWAIDHHYINKRLDIA